MRVHSAVHELSTGDGIDMVNLDDVVGHVLRESGVNNGILTVSSRHTTTAVIVNEYEQRLLDDLESFFGRLVPSTDSYRHNDIHLRDCPDDEPENAHSHIIAMLLSAAQVIPVVNGKLQLGKWQSVILCELDGPRNRQVNLQVMGECQ
jgi:secondary thiamine-phosphate synthase enzyme